MTSTTATPAVKIWLGATFILAILGSVLLLAIPAALAQDAAAATQIDPAALSWPAPFPIAYLGDEALAAGWRLAGLRTWTPADPGQLRAQLELCREDCELILIEARLVEWLTAPELDHLRRRLRPLLLELAEGCESAAAQPAVRRADVEAEFEQQLLGFRHQIGSGGCW